LNLFGAYCLGLREDYEPPSPADKNLQVLPTREIVALGEQELLAGDRFFLEKISHQKSDRVWCLDRDRLMDYLELGGSLEEIEMFLPLIRKTSCIRP